MVAGIGHTLRRGKTKSRTICSFWGTVTSWSQSHSVPLADNHRRSQSVGVRCVCEFWKRRFSSHIKSNFTCLSAGKSVCVAMSLPQQLREER